VSTPHYEPPHDPEFEVRDTNFQGMKINMGPQHPSTHGVLRLILTLDGEEVVDCESVIGYLHRGLEKMAERRPYRQFIPFTDRLDYLCAIAGNLACAQAIERLASVEVPERAQWLRIVLLELNRIASHLLFIGTFGSDLGATTALLYAFREREACLDVMEAITGARLTYNWIRVGGVPEDMPEGWDKGVLEFCDLIESRLPEYDKLLTKNPVFRARCEGIGVIDADEAVAYGLSGPTLRGSGVAHDIRRFMPHDAYDRVEFDVCTRPEGDVMARYLVRVCEIGESIRIVRQALEKMPEGPVLAKVPKVLRPPAGEAYSMVEAPRGELSFYMVSDGSANPLRVHIRAPSFCNLGALSRLVIGTKVADVVSILGSMDIVLGEVDR
jgi:NADH-quinone oxidoreductase subunit D